MNYNDFMEKALKEAETALTNNEFPVGCVIVYEGRIITSGSRRGTSGENINEIDHAEIVALKRLADLGDTIDKSKATLFCTLEPCLMCFGAILLSGIREIVYAYEDVMGGGTSIDLTQLTPLYQQLDCAIVPHILRSRSLALFKTYFNKAENIYWQNSLLARYTLTA